MTPSTRRVPDAFMAGLMNRVGELKASQLELPIVVLDATLPNQRLAISTSDQAFREMIEYCGVKAVEEAGDEQLTTIHGTATRPRHRRRRPTHRGHGAISTPFGVEVRRRSIIILKASVASETCSVELKGGRRFTVDETQEEAPAGAVQPRKVTLAPDLDDDDEAAAAAAERCPRSSSSGRLPELVEQWEKLVVDGRPRATTGPPWLRPNTFGADAAARAANRIGVVGRRVCESPTSARRRPGDQAAPP